MNLGQTIQFYEIFAGGSGSGCQGPNCGRKSISMYNYDPEHGHDKVYHLQIKKHPSGGYVVNYQHGRRNGTLKEGTHTKTPVSLQEAHRVFEKSVSKRYDHDYKEGAYSESKAA